MHGVNLCSQCMNTRFVSKLAAELFSDQPKRAAFIEALSKPHYPERALVWRKERPKELPFALKVPSDFQPDFVDRVADPERPGAHELHEKGDYYCLDLSSVFCAAALREIAPMPQNILDLCAAPGGKSVVAWRMFTPQTLLCNEAIAKRLPALISNLKRLEISPVSVCSYDPQRLAAQLGDTFDLVLCDVPCSGQSLVVKGRPSPGCFHPSTINLNANRQRRIMANALKLVKPGGYAAYITCTFSLKENEAVLEWLLKKFPDFHPVTVQSLASYRSDLSLQPCYRLWPFQFSGAGAFVALLKREGDLHPTEPKIDGLRIAWSNCS